MTQPSDLLRQAQAKLKALQIQARQQRVDKGLPIDVKQKTAVSQQAATVVQSLPSHLGWESDRFTAWIRYQADKQAPIDTAVTPTPVEVTPQVTAGGMTAITTRPDHIVLWPAVAMGMLKQELVAPGRLWLLLRWADERGRGWLSVKEAQALLADKASPHRLCGKANFRQLLRRGQGVFWQRDKQRIWLRSTSKVAHALGVWAVQGKMVQLPVSVLTSRIGEVRSHFYASFHSGRQQEGIPKPIARMTMHKAYGVPASTQRAYERRCGVGVEANFAVGAKETAASKSQIQHQKYQAYFPFTDYKGQRGPKMTKYVAWQLPNSYAGPHPHQSATSRSRMNKQLRDLRMKKSAGNGQLVVQGQTQRQGGGGGRRCQRYHRDGKRVGQVKPGGTPLFWRGPQKSYPQAQLWHCRYLPHPLEEEKHKTL